MIILVVFRSCSAISFEHFLARFDLLDQSSCGKCILATVWAGKNLRKVRDITGIISLNNLGAVKNRLGSFAPSFQLLISVCMISSFVYGVSLIEQASLIVELLMILINTRNLLVSLKVFSRAKANEQECSQAQNSLC